MDASSFVMRPTNSCFSRGDAGFHTQYSHMKPRTMMGSSSSCSSSSSSMVKRGAKQLDFGFYDKGQLNYYMGNRIRCGGGDGDGCGKREKVKVKKGKEEKKMVKKKLKLLKGLSTDLSMFSKMMMGSVHGLVDDDDQVKPEMMSEAAELLLGHLQKLRAEEKELKRKKKEEKKALLRAARLQNGKLGCDMSSSSSSESSDSERDEEVVSMSRLKSDSVATQPISSANPPVIEIETVNNNDDSSISTPVGVTPPLKSIVPSLFAQEDNIRNSSSLLEQECCSGTSERCRDVRTSLVEETRIVTGLSSAKIEVCMGGKCKKSGAATLLEEFQKVVGADVAVSGCKCMGKCKDGPNVRVVNNNSIDVFAADVRTPSNPLCIGVGLEDVSLIMTNFFGENQRKNGFAAAAANAAS